MFSAVSLCVCVCSLTGSGRVCGVVLMSVCVSTCGGVCERERGTVHVSRPQARRLALPLSSINHGDCFLIPLP